ncbi:MAG: hypothetical protein QNJ19_16080 [Woeseiaceae bacterium]|nr:hypothetical protein [Woeseiaceae bacterium]
MNIADGTDASEGSDVSTPLRTLDRLLYGVVFPIVIMAALLFVIMHADTRAGAAEFAALGIFLGAIVAAPVVLITNLVLAFQTSETARACFKRGMIAPTVVIVGAIVYQTGLWDALT